ncbi:MAG: response regulator transcription factor [Lachnospiraceae bacterium]|nr:response regulator transcription factor [Lachnospiraceae bacterium]
MKKVRVLVVDDQSIIRYFFSYILENMEKYELAAAVPNGEAAVEYCKNSLVDLVLMDVVMVGGINGLEAARQIKAYNPAIKIIIVTSMPEVTYLDRARSIGVESFWYKEMQENLETPILAVMDRTMEGEHIYPDTTPELTLGKAKSVDLTVMELNILREVTTGATNREIAEKMGISAKTVDFHIQNLLAKTGYKNRVQLAVKARIEGLVIGEE